MARPRNSLAKAKLTGAAAKDPQRYRDRGAAPSEPIGLPPDFLPDGARKAWREFVKEWPWLRKSDRTGVAALCIMRARLEEEPDSLGSPFFKEYRMQLAAYGGTPTSVSKIGYKPEGEDGDEFDQFVQ